MTAHQWLESWYTDLCHQANETLLQIHRAHQQHRDTTELYHDYERITNSLRELQAMAAAAHYWH